MTERLDAVVAARGLARSRTHAAQLIADGLVRVDGRPVVKSSVRVADDADIAVAASDHYVSRAAHKLLAGLDSFGVAVRGRVALDLGASTGGFTQVLRERGADPVLAVDVGHDQLAPAIAADPGVVAVEGYNVRYMTRANLAEATGVDAAPSLVTGDLSFISLLHVVPAIAGVVAADADVVLLVKPQFEVGRTAVKGGLVSDRGLRADAIAAVQWAAWDVGLGSLGVHSSPLPGTHGNVEFLVHLAPGRGTDPSQWWSTVTDLAERR